MTDFGFVPRVMGLAPIVENMIRIVVQPSFHPEEVWDVSVDGVISIRRGKESIWASIPQRVKRSGDKEWTYVSYANFSVEECEVFGYKINDFSMPKLVNAIASYKCPEMVCCDGIGFIFTRHLDGVANHIRIHQPAESELLDLLKGYFQCLNSHGYRSDSGKYLGMA